MRPFISFIILTPHQLIIAFSAKYFLSAHLNPTPFTSMSFVLFYKEKSNQVRLIFLKYKLIQAC